MQRGNRSSVLPDRGESPAMLDRTRAPRVASVVMHANAARDRYNVAMSDLSKIERDEEDERPGLLQQIRPIAKVVFGAIAVSAVVGFVFGLCHVALGLFGFG
jgi:hypothetical protein